MTRVLGEIASGVGSSNAKLFLANLGIEIEKIIALPADEQFNQIGTAIAGLGTQAEKAAAAQAIFGTSGIKLINLFDSIGTQAESVRQEVELFGTAISRVEAAKIEEANDAMFRLEQVAAGVATQISVELAPVITALAKEITDWVKASGGIPKLIGDATETAKKG